MATLSTVAVDFIANTAKYVAGLSQMSNTTKKWANDTKQSTDSATNSLNNTSKSASGLSTVFKGLGVAAIAGAALGVAKLSKELIDAVGKLNDLSFQTNISVQNLQRLETIFEKSGATIEDVSAMYGKLEKASQDAYEGNINLLKSFAELGINVDSFNKLAAQQKIEQYAIALSKIEDPAKRASLALEITGKVSRKTLEGFNEIAQKGSIEAAANDVFVNSERVNQALDSTGDAFSRATTVAKRFATEALGLVVIGFQSTVDDAKKAGKSIEEYVKQVENKFLPLLARLKQLGIDKPSETFFPGPKPPAPLIIIDEEVEARAKKAADEARNAQVEREKAQKKVNDLFLASVDPLAKYNSELDKLRKEAEKLNIPRDILIQREQKLTEEYQKQTREIELNRNAAERRNKELFGLTQTGPGGLSPFAAEGVTQPFFTTGQKVQLDILENRLRGIATFASTPEAIQSQVDQQKSLELLKKQSEAAKKLGEDLLENSRTAEEIYADRVLAFNQAAVEFEKLGKFDEANRIRLEGFKQAADELLRLNPAFQTLATFGDNFATGLASAIAEGQNFSDAFKNVFKSVLRDIQVLILRTLILQAIMASIGFVTGGINSDAAQSFGKLTGLIPKARGGPVNTNNAYLVGEQGPEMFVPSSNGVIIPNDMMAGESTNVTQNIYIQTGVAQTVRAEMISLLPRFKQEAISGVLDAKQRGGSYAKGLVGA